MTRPTPKRIPLNAAFDALVLGAVWGLTFLVIKWGLRDAGPVTLGALRVLVGAVGLVTLARLLAGPVPRSGRAHLEIAAVGMIQVGVFGALLNLGTARTNVGVTSLIIYSQPAIVAVLAVRWLGERLRPSQAVGVAVGVVGLALVVLGQQGIETGAPWVGYALLIGAATSWAAGAVLFRRLRPALPFLWAVALQTAYAGVALCGAAVVSEGPDVRFTGRLVLVTLFLGFGASGLAYLLWFRLLVGPSAVAASTSLLFVPLWAAVFGVVLRGERWTMSAVSGGICILGGVWLVYRGTGMAAANDPGGGRPDVAPRWGGDDDPGP